LVARWPGYQYKAVVIIEDTEGTMARKTKLMQRVEKEFQRPLERLLPEKVNEVGLSATAEELGVSKATLGYWLLKLGINVRRVALAPGETLEVKRIS
tara:strand:- start:44 stop:334 length:291 start_codon:yes stop_codon:yes gene_type:complete